MYIGGGNRCQPKSGLGNWQLIQPLVGNEIVTSTLQYLSTLSGPVLACTCGAIVTLIPIHNVLKYPSYWYEDVTVSILGGGLIFGLQQLIRAEYWSNFTFEKRWSTYVLIIALTALLFLIIISTYHYVWTIMYNLYEPKPLTLMMSGTLTIVIINVALVLR